MTLNTESTIQHGHTIVFYDGECGLCQRSVQWLLKRDKYRVLRYAPLQGETAKTKLPPEQTEDLDSMVLLLPSGEQYTHSSAVLRSMIALGGIYKLGGVFLVVPPAIRNVVYRWVAKRRLKFFVKTDACRMPTAEERELFLD